MLVQRFERPNAPDISFAQTAFFRRSPSRPEAFSALSPTPLSLRDLIQENPTCTMSNVAVTRAAFQRSGGFESDMVHSEDLAWLIRCAGLGFRIEGSTDFLTFYRCNESGLSADIDAMHCGWRRAIRFALAADPSISERELAAAEATHLRYLARRALHTGAPRTSAARYVARAISVSVNGYFNQPRRAFAILIAVNRGVKRGQFPVEYRSILLVQDGPLACVSYS